MTDDLLFNADGTAKIEAIPYDRNCPECEKTLGSQAGMYPPSMHELIDGETFCARCKQGYVIDSEDLAVVLAWALARIDRLEMELKRRSPLSGLGI